MTTLDEERITRKQTDLLRGTRALLADPYSVVLDPKSNGYETAEGERLLLDSDEAGPTGIRCSFATAPRQVARELGMDRFHPLVNHVFGLLHIEAAERGWHSLDSALAEAGAPECLSIVDAVVEAITSRPVPGSTNALEGSSHV